MSLPIVGLIIALPSCSYRELQPPPHTVAIQWESPDFGTLTKAMVTCRIPDLEDDSHCASRRAEVQQAMDAHSFCARTQLLLFSCRAIERTVQRQYADFIESATLAGVSVDAEPFQLKPYSPITNPWLSAEWRWKDRGTLIHDDLTGFAAAACVAALVLGSLVFALGQISVIRFRSKAQELQDAIENARLEAMEQIQMVQDQERRWLTLLHLQFLSAGIERFAVGVDPLHLVDDIWTATNGADQCNRRDITMTDVHRPTGVKLIVTNVPSRFDREGWQFHVHFGVMQDAVGCRRPESLLCKQGDADWSEHRTIEQIPWQRADIAMAVARRLLLRAMRGQVVLHPRGAAVPKGWQPYPEEIEQYLVAEPSPGEVDQARS